jgi:hypothetical protein
MEEPRPTKTIPSADLEPVAAPLMPIDSGNAENRLNNMENETPEPGTETESEPTTSNFSPATDDIENQNSEHTFARAPEISMEQQRPTMQLPRKKRKTRKCPKHCIKKTLCKRKKRRSKRKSIKIGEPVPNSELEPTVMGGRRRRRKSKRNKK